MTHGTNTDPSRCVELAGALGMLASDLLVIAGHPVPAELRPPERDLRVVREFTYRVTFCDHSQMAALKAFIHTLPAAVPHVAMLAEPLGMRGLHPDASRFATILRGLLHNRGLGPRELPFVVLSVSTIMGRLVRDRQNEHRWPTLSKLAGPLGWKFQDLIVVAGEPLTDRPRWEMHCHHVGQIYVAAIPLTTEQLIAAIKEADRLSGRPDQGAWRPASEGFAAECPDLTSPDPLQPQFFR
ncbi:hypothetical protein Rhe02_33900 [Rhizocola hellebori]|uniref:Uncharacterized protein n=1 Tax=Rhizocola hellebori TaxID=1392758 RepID=A0A8J3VGX4_9ACTN|nr:hypothetical protein Rhe02_33900 [Rhizocola hellebori]